MHNFRYIRSVFLPSTTCSYLRAYEHVASLPPFLHSIPFQGQLYVLRVRMVVSSVSPISVLEMSPIPPESAAALFPSPRLLRSLSFLHGATNCGCFLPFPLFPFFCQQSWAFEVGLASNCSPKRISEYLERKRRRRGRSIHIRANA